MRMTTLVTWFCAVFLIAGWAEHALAQATPGTFADANHPAGASDPEKLDAIWSVDPINDQVSIRIPFATTPQGGRGPRVPFALLYNSASTVTLQSVGDFAVGSGAQVENFVWSANPIGFSGSLTAPAGPWTTSGPYFYSSSANVPDVGFTDRSGYYHVTGVGCIVSGPYTYVDQDGAAHDMNLLGFSAPGGPPGSSQSWAPACQPAQSQSPSYWPSSTTSDGSALSTSSGSTTAPDGTTAIGSLTSTGASAGGGTLTDVNGNSASVNTVNGVTTAIDALGRTVYTTNIPFGQPGQIPAGSYYLTTYGSTGVAETYTVIFSSLATGSYTMPHPDPANYEISNPTFCFGSCTFNFGVGQPTERNPYSTFTAITEIDLPDNTSSYKFTYDSTYGTISKITFPTGGYVRFGWAIRDKDWTPYGQFGAISAVVVTDAYTSTCSNCAENHWTYTMESLSTSSTPIGKIVAPDSSWTNYVGACFVSTSVPYYAFQAKGGCKEASHATYGYSSAKGVGGVLLQSDAKSFYGTGDVYQEAVTFYDGPTPLQKLVQYVRDAYSNVTEKDESGYYSCSASPLCPGPTLSAPTTGWLRKTYTTFAYATKTSLAGKHIVDKPSQVIVTDGNGKPFSLVNYTYDNNGNLTNESKCISLSGTHPNEVCSAYWQTQYAVDGHGQVTQKVDGYGASSAATTNYTWTGPAGQSDSYNGYLTTVTHPTGATDAYTYYASTGQIATHTDWNTHTTNYSYSDPSSGNPDPLNRIRTIIDPLKAVATYNYTDSAGDFSVEELHTANSLGDTTDTTTFFDGLGRKITTKTISPSCTSPIEVDTTYDSMSRTHSVSNPYCTTSDTTYGLTTYLYDGLGRKYQVTTPDSAATTITYGGNATEFTEPSNGTVTPQHIQGADGLGHPAAVCEVTSSTYGSIAPSPCGLNISGTGYLTQYTYDPMDNLVAVSQHGVSRSFTYDNLGRLTQTVNPEAGTTNYTYSNSTSACAADPSLPCSKTDGRGVKTSYAYDALNRLLSKSYSDTTPSSCFQYDDSGVSNSTGRVSAEWTQAGACPATAPTSGFITMRKFLAYDAMGRVLSEQQCTPNTSGPGSCAAATPFLLPYDYDLAGHVISYTNGVNNVPVVGTFTFTPQYNETGQLQNLSTSWNSSTLFTALPSNGYTAFGAIQNIILGNNILLNKTYDNRLRVTGQTATHP